METTKKPWPDISTSNFPWPVSIQQGSPKMISQDFGPSPGTVVLINDACATPHSEVQQNTVRQESNLNPHLITESLGSLWHDDPSSQWQKDQKIKNNHGAPDFQHKVTKQPLWGFCGSNPCWVREELRKRGPHPPVDSLDVEDAKDKQKGRHMEKEEEMSRDEGETLSSSNNCTQKLSEDVNEAISFVSSLKICAHQRDLERGSIIHAMAARKGLLKTNAILGGTIVNMYAKCGAFAQAEEVFYELPVRNIVAWNALIAGYVQNEHNKEAWACFMRMEHEDVSPDAITIVCILKACGRLGDVDKGRKLHALVVKMGLLEVNLVVANVLIDMYARCCELGQAQHVLDGLQVSDVVSWTTLITGYVQHEDGKRALECYETMQLKGVSPNIATFLCILKACGIEGAIDAGQKIHSELVIEGIVGDDMVAGTSLVDMYAKCEMLAEAEDVFEELPGQDVVSWGALIAGYTQHMDGENALNCFERMQEGGYVPDAVTFTCILKACGSIGVAQQGQQIHVTLLGNGLLERDIVVANAIVDMYAKCGMLVEAHDVFNELPMRYIISWNALIAGYAHIGNDYVAFDLFGEMMRGVEPDFVTYTILLNLCSHRGLLVDGHYYFESMITSYGIYPMVEHFTCMLDLYARAGHVDEATMVINAMPVLLDLSAWHAVMGACLSARNTRVGLWAFENAAVVAGKRSGAYIFISNIYATSNKQRNSLLMEEAMMEEARRIYLG